MSRARALNGGAYCRTDFQAIAKTATAGSTGDATEVNGAWADRQSDYGISLSAKLVIVYEAVLGEGETLKFSGNFQDASDASGTGAADFGDAFSAQTAATGDSGGQTVDGTFEVDVSLADADRYIRAQVTPNLSASSTDTLKWSAMLVFFGESRAPSTGADVTIGLP